MKSNCCQVGVIVVGGDEGTNYWKCEKCGKPCDLYYPSISTCDYCGLPNRDLKTYGKGEPLSVDLCEECVRYMDNELLLRKYKQSLIKWLEGEKKRPVINIATRSHNQTISKLIKHIKEQ